MKKSIVVLVVDFLFIAVNGFAADGDLIVNGSVGIGTTNPSYKLDVQGQIQPLRPLQSTSSIITV